MKKKSTAIAVIILIAVILIGGAAAYLLLSNSENDDQQVAYVQSVKDIAGLGSGSGLKNRYSGVVEAQEVLKVNLDQEKTLGECFVEIGDEVNAGDPLFSYDIESLQFNLEQLKLDLEGMDNEIKTMEDQIVDLQKQIKNTWGDEKVELTIQLQTTELNLKKQEYERKKKELEVANAQVSVQDNVVTAQIDGVIRSINPPGSQSEDMWGVEQDTSYITIISSEDYRVKGTISEQTVHLLSPGMPVVLRSRIDESTIWTGSIDYINLEQAEGNSNDAGIYYPGMDSAEQASKYAFYITLNSNENLMMGQHIYIELDEGQTQQKEGIWLPSYYFVLENDEYFVYADNGRERIEQRKITVGEYDEGMDTYQVLEGLTEEDYIAFPDESIQSGVKAVKSDTGGGMVDPGMMEPGIIDGGIESDSMDFMPIEDDGAFEQEDIMPDENTEDLLQDDIADMPAPRMEGR
ncbi:MAG: efflux RND transporter periplasmic adaptor subunit [Christensenellales bacterium]|jgi:HlyD family secretion protein